ncbi:hypothetical protein BSPA14S_A0065 (plasmid) [Borreliella spielmanii A14S]|uniref:Uncharacterized protein n=1 Tax=Borreliella spielmanii A14S TaxID=498742 RepID=C0RC74_9SPIR|nr:hypothetical protein BSPA14S_A0065 [Borreliella spielmanii A14S]
MNITATLILLSLLINPNKKCVAINIILKEKLILLFFFKKKIN